MNSQEYLKQNNQNTSSSRMSKVYSAPIREKTLSKSYRPLMTWATMSNGACLTHNTSEPHNIVRELSLSQAFRRQVSFYFFLFPSTPSRCNASQVSRSKVSRKSSTRTLYPNISSKSSLLSHRLVFNIKTTSL